MPELPEVETVKNGLEKHIVGKKIEAVFLGDKKLRVPFPPNLVEYIKKSKIVSLARRAKYILINLDNNRTLIIHLGMTGKLLFKHKPYTKQTHDHFIMEFNDNSLVVFNDARRFGLVTFEDTKDVVKSKVLRDAGVEPFSDEFDEKYLWNAFRNKTQSVKQALMDGGILSGVGNIYASEALFLSSINPTIAAGKISIPKLKILKDNIVKVLAAAIKSGGSTLRDYVRSDGDVGHFQHEFKVYGRENQPCIVCRSLIKRIVQQGRSTFYCPKCQSLKK